MSRSVQLAPSILAADFAALGRDIAAVERGGADLIHVDVMDGHFVPNITIGPPVVRSIKSVATVPLDVHLMISDPDRYIDAFAEAGASMMSVHVEVLPHLHRTITAIKALGVKAGVVEKAGAWFSYDSIRIGQGRENAKQFLKDNPEVADRLEAAIRGQTDGLAEEMMAGPDADDDI